MNYDQAFDTTDDTQIEVSADHGHVEINLQTETSSTSGVMTPREARRLIRMLTEALDALDED